MDSCDLNTPKPQVAGKEEQGSSVRENSNKKKKSSTKRNSKNNTPKKNALVNGSKGMTDVARKIDFLLEATAEKLNSIFDEMKESNDLSTPTRKEEEQGSYIGDNSNKKRKSPAKITPRKRNSRNNTPKKNALVNGSKGMSDVARKIDLRLEAKLSAEENSRMYAGRPIHPFFTMHKVGKKCDLPSTKSESSKIISPIHVFEDIKDDTSSLDWTGWTLMENTCNVHCDPENLSSHVMEGSVESLNFDNLFGATRPSSTSISQSDCSDQFSISDNMVEISPANMLANDHTRCPLKPEDVIVDFEMDKVSTESGACFLRDSNNEALSRFLQESMRSYYQSCKHKAEGSLWIHKYKPTKAFEVCGNDESLKFLRSWLYHWHERRYRSRTESSNKNQSDMINTDDDNRFDRDNASKDINEEGFLHNVLLITGPVGSGKSAAVYACAQEQGFEILEINASDCRNGAAIKQNFGEALELHCFKRSVEQTVSPLKSNDGADTPTGTSQRLHDKNNAITFVQSLLLVEDVDILFPQDRGCIAAIQHIAESAKGPIILTSNSNNAGLPDNFARLHVSFSLPLPDELLCHLYMICVTEEVNICPLLLKKFIQCCNRDIRKTIMHLQYWFQNNKYSKDRKVQTVYGSLPFDLQAGHQILPKIIPWSFPSELSTLIEKELSNSITMMEKESCSQGFVKEELHINEKHNDLDVQCTETDYLVPNVELMKMNRSITNCSEFESQYNAISEFSNSVGPSETSSLQNDQRNLVVISSDSMDNNPNNRHFVDVHEVDKRQPFEGIREPPCQFQLNQSSASMPFCKLLYSGLEDSNEEQYEYLETTNDACLNSTFKSFDMSCFQEPGEDANQNTIDRVVSSGHLPEIPKSTVQDFSDENMGATTAHHRTDDYSQAKFELQSKFVDACNSMVQGLWRNLRDCRTDLVQAQQTGSEPIGAFEVVKLASDASKLISDADLLFRNHQQKQCGLMEPPIFLSDEATFKWYDEQMMMSTIAVHGFCFYAKYIEDVGSKLGYENRVDITSEMLASTTNIMALGKFSRHDQNKSMSNFTKKLIEVKNSRNDKSIQFYENRTSLSKVVRCIVPTRLSLVTKGVALDEYLSSLRQISISESFRISRGVKKMRKGRRSAEHYLSRGKLILSPEDISLVCEGDLYRKMYSHYAANLESNCT